MIDHTKWQNALPSLRGTYQEASPFPHIVIDDFCDPPGLRNVCDVFPKVSDSQWTHYLHYNEKKHGLSRFEVFPSPIQQIISQLNSDAFVTFISGLTGIDGLFCDPDLAGGGLHQSQRGGFLRIHSDFTSHPHHSDWRRRINVLIYLNEDWDTSFGGQLELWTADMKQCAARINPIFNRCVIFNTDETSFHGHPEPLTCPDHLTRKSIALYYYTRDNATPSRATTYMARPDDHGRRSLIKLDNHALMVYHWMRHKLGISDGLVSSILRKFTKMNK